MNEQTKIVIDENRKYICETLNINYSKLKNKQKTLVDNLVNAYIYYGLVLREKDDKANQSN